MSQLEYSDEFFKLLKSRDKKAWRTLSDTATPSLFKVIRYTLNQSLQESSDATCLDILQESFMSFFNQPTLDRIQDHSKIYAYLKSICVFKTIDRVRTKIAEEKHISDTPIQNESDFESAVLEDPVRGQVDAKIISELIERIINSLTGRERLIVQLCWKDGVTYLRASKITGISRNTIAALLKRVKARIAEELRKYYED